MTETKEDFSGTGFGGGVGMDQQINALATKPVSGTCTWKEGENQLLTVSSDLQARAVAQACSAPK